jgi:hypothetical protein
MNASSPLSLIATALVSPHAVSLGNGGIRQAALKERPSPAGRWSHPPARGPIQELVVEVVVLLVVVLVLLVVVLVLLVVVVLVVVVSVPEPLPLPRSLAAATTHWL